MCVTGLDISYSGSGLMLENESTHSIDALLHVYCGMSLC